MQGKLSSLFVRLAGWAKRVHFIPVAGGLALLAASAFFLNSCGGSNAASVAPPPVPSILNINNSTDPSNPVGLPIGINGSGFQGSPGSVVFTQSSSGITATVTPNSGGWSDSGIAVTVPTGDGTNNFTVPGTVTVSVKTSGGTSNTKDLTLVQTLTFNVNNVTWATTTPLPVSPGLTGLGAAAVPIDNLNAFVVLTGGNNGSANTSTVLCNTLNADGTVGPDWTTIPTNPLPENLAYHAMVEADSSNSLVPTGSHFIYVIGGQVDSTAAPGGTANVYMASVDSNSGAVGAWTKLASSLPLSLVGPAVTLFNGYVYLIGGLKSDGTPSSDVYSAPVNKDGTLGDWTKSANSYPMAVSFATAFGFAGRLYVLGGDPNTSLSPGAQGSPGVNNANFATALNGVVGTWTVASPTIKKRKKQITWTAFGQVIDAEGIYEGTPGSLELERSQINPDSTLAAWNGITASVNQIGDNVYNAAAIVSPLQSPTSTPRFLLFGGQKFVTFSPGPLSSQVYYNNAP